MLSAMIAPAYLSGKPSAQVAEFIAGLVSVFLLWWHAVRKEIMLDVEMLGRKITGAYKRVRIVPITLAWLKVEIPS